MAGQRQKAPDQLAFQRGSRGRGLVVVRDPNRKAPAMPRPPVGVKWNATARAAWREYWKTPISAATDTSADSEQLRRWVEMVHQRAELMGKVEVEGWTGDWGSQGQMVEHPSLGTIKHLDKEIMRFAEHFGLTPLSRFRLQITVSEAGQAEDKLQRILDRRKRESEAPQERSVEAKVVDL